MTERRFDAPFKRRQDPVLFESVLCERADASAPERSQV
jgi:hypothetical protein